MSKKNPHWGTALDTFLSEDSIHGAAKAKAITRVVAWQLVQEMERQGMTKALACGDDTDTTGTEKP